LGRICPEKGFHYALDAAALARTPLLIAGRVFPYPDHEQYFAEEMEPRLGPLARLLGNPDLSRNPRFLSAGRGLLIASLIAERSFRWSEWSRAILDIIGNWRRQRHLPPKRDGTHRAGHVRGCDGPARAGMAGPVAEGSRCDPVPVTGVAVVVVGLFRERSAI